MNQIEKETANSINDDPYDCRGQFPGGDPNPWWCRSSQVNNETVSFEIIHIDNRKNIIFVTDYGFSWVLMKIAGGILSEAGAAIFRELTNNDVSPANVVRESVLRFKEVLRSEFDRQKLLEATDLISKSEVNVNHYFNDPTNNRNYLETAIQDLRSALATLRRLGPVVASGSYMVAAGLELSCIQERAKWVPSDTTIVKEHARVYAEEARRFLPEICRVAKNRFSGLDGELGPNNYMIWWYYRDKGTTYQWESEHFPDDIVGTGQTRCLIDRCEKMGYVLKDIERNDVNPMAKLIQAWEELGNS